MNDNPFGVHSEIHNGCELQTCNKGLSGYFYTVFSFSGGVRSIEHDSREDVYAYDSREEAREEGIKYINNMEITNE